MIVPSLGTLVAHVVHRPILSITYNYIASTYDSPHGLQVFLIVGLKQIGDIFLQYVNNHIQKHIMERNIVIP